MNSHDCHRGYGLNTDSIDADIANLVVKQGGDVILKSALDNNYGGFERNVVEVPFRGRWSAADEYARIVVKTGNYSDESVVLILANHHEKPYIQLASSKDNTRFSKDVELIKHAFNLPFEFKPHKLSRIPINYMTGNNVQYFENKALYDFTSDVDWYGQPDIPNNFLVADVDKSVLDSFDFNNIKDFSKIHSLTIGKGNDFEDPWQHENLLALYNIYLTVEPVREILKDGSKDNLSAIVGSGIFFDEISRCRDVNSLQSELAVLLEKYRKPDTAVAFGRKPFGTSKPYFIGPNTDIKKMINKIISNSSDHEIKGIMHDDTVVIKDMYKGLMRGDATSQKYAIQLKETAKEINSELPKESTLKTLLSYAISHMT